MEWGFVSSVSSRWVIPGVVKQSAAAMVEYVGGMTSNNQNFHVAFSLN